MALRTALRERTALLMDEVDAAELAGAPDELELLALRAARGRGPRQTSTRSAPEVFGPGVDEVLLRLVRILDADEHEDVVALLSAFPQLDRRRRRMLVELVADLRTGRERDLGI